MALQKTLLILKPDAVARGLMGKIIDRIEAKGLKIIGMKMTRMKPALAKQHYAEHKGKPFFGNLIEFITSGPIVLMAVEGNEAVTVCRKLIGATNGMKAEPGTIRGDFGMSGSKNLIHGSDSAASARREVKLFFKPSELVKIPKDELAWVYTLGEEI